jgi:hypothetical protein
MLVRVDAVLVIKFQLCDAVMSGVHVHTRLDVDDGQTDFLQRARGIVTVFTKHTPTQIRR